MKELYNHQIATVRTPMGETEEVHIGKGVEQGCVLSPYLFNMYSEYLVRAVELDTDEAGFRIGGLKINNLRYADDTTLLAESTIDLQNLLRKVKQNTIWNCHLTRRRRR